MLWSVLVASLVGNALILKWRVQRRAEIPGDVPDPRELYDRPALKKWEQVSAKLMLDQATSALTHREYVRARAYAEKAISMLETAPASEAQLVFARRVLHEALWPGLYHAA